MTIENDLCDFCGGYCDGIGCDTKQGLQRDGTMWCGQCEWGRTFKFRFHKSSQLREQILMLLGQNAASGLSWENRGTDGRAWLEFVRQTDFISDARRELERRSTRQDLYRESEMEFEGWEETP